MHFMVPGHAAGWFVFLLLSMDDNLHPALPVSDSLSEALPKVSSAAISDGNSNHTEIVVGRTCVISDTLDILPRYGGELQICTVNSLA